MQTLSINRKPKGIYQKPLRAAPAVEPVPAAMPATSQKERRQPAGKRRKNIKARARKVGRLIDYWPQLFSLDAPRPLKVGILDDLITAIAAGGITFGTGSLKAALAAYTRRTQYQEALAAGGRRFDLAGQSCGEVTAEQQQAAAELVEKSEKGGQHHDKGQ
ncbi:TPA: ProQ/FINO family protein [Pluralibacter gergoviae]